MEESNKIETGDIDTLEVGVGLLDPDMFVDVLDEILDYEDTSGLNCEDVCYDRNELSKNKRRLFNSNTVEVSVY